MDPDLIKRVLGQLRGQPSQGVNPAPQMAAPIAPTPGLDQAYSAPTGITGSSSPFQLNQGLENQVNQAGGNNQLEPLLQQIMQRLGMMSMIRNRSNEIMNAGIQG